MGNNVKNAVRGLQIIFAVLNFFKTIFIVVGMAAIEYFRSKAKSAEDRASVAETELTVMKEKVKINEETSKKSAKDIVRGYLRGGAPGDSAGR